MGYLGLTVDPALYMARAGVAFVEPPNPGILPVIPFGSTVALTSELVRQHTQALKVWRERQDVDMALKQQLLGAVNDIYLRTKRDSLTGYASVTVWQLIKHLLVSYGRITPNAISANDTRMRTPFDADQPIEVLFTQIEYGMQYAAAGNAAYSAQQIIIIAYALIFASDAYPEACREWRKKTEVDKTWTNFKEDFASAYHDRCEASTTTQ